MKKSYWLVQCHISAILEEQTPTNQISDCGKLVNYNCYCRNDILTNNTYKRFNILNPKSINFKLFAIINSLTLVSQQLFLY